MSRAAKMHLRRAAPLLLMLAASMGINAWQTSVVGADRKTITREMELIYEQKTLLDRQDKALKIFVQHCVVLDGKHNIQTPGGEWMEWK